MRVTYFMDTPRLGGAERFLADLAAGVGGAGHEVTVVSPQPFLLDLVRSFAPDARLVSGGRTDYFSATPGLSTIAALIRAIPELRRTIARTKPDVLHANNGGYPGSDLCRLAVLVGRGAGTPRSILSVHNPAFPREASRPQLQAVVDRLTWRSSDVVHATSAFVERSLVTIRGMPPALGRHIPYGVHQPAGSPDEVQALRSELTFSGRLLIGLVAATGEPHKGHEIFIEALAESGIDAAAVIVGPHPGEHFPRQIAELGLDARVTLAGPVESSEVGRYVRAIDLLVVPSTAHESLPYVILEAMAAGKPVFASSLAGIPEAVIDGETGRLFTPGAVDELTGLLREAPRDREDLAAMGEAGHERWRTRFAPEVLVESMLALYRELLGQRIA
jgi:glycosyltransferase involved in cell wall biosynthesis